jgi:hypothetical protein
MWSSAFRKAKTSVLGVGGRFTQALGVTCPAEEMVLATGNELTRAWIEEIGFGELSPGSAAPAAFFLIAGMPALASDRQSPQQHRVSASRRQ